MDNRLKKLRDRLDSAYEKVEQLYLKGEDDKANELETQWLAKLKELERLEDMLRAVQMEVLSAGQ